MRILEGVSIQVDAGELVCLLGGNASGKSTTLKTILGLVRPRSGRVLLDAEDVTDRRVPERIARGMAIVPENRRLFGYMTVRENLELGAVLQDGSTFKEDLERVHTPVSAPARAPPTSWPARCPAASSRWWRWAGR